MNPQHTASDGTDRTLTFIHGSLSDPAKMAYLAGASLILATATWVLTAMLVGSLDIEIRSFGDVPFRVKLAMILGAFGKGFEILTYLATVLTITSMVIGSVERGRAPSE